MAEVPNLLPVSENLNTKNGNFICGVVEGFYGRPWTTEQRKDLFQKMKKWGMDSYVYAPKDDYKHRAYWRELYTVEEAEHLTGLIQAAKDQNITFYYALSPGLDITYSSTKEITTLKRKLEQVSQFGCIAFALLFDDIESEMSEADKEIFQSFAQAQVAITNDIYQHLGQPKFLICPTQYCSTRAVPDITNSEYLNTLGLKLAQEINIMWTGQKVITRTLTRENIQEITDALRRPPVIWDNLHANDYDQKRVFLGPYSGRSPDLIPKLRGVLTNPNCEYGANFIAIHTLAQWSRCNLDGQRDPMLNDTVSADIKLETETEDGQMGEDVPITLSPNMYHPKQALKNAIKEWLAEFSKYKAAWGPIAKPQPTVAVIPLPIIPSINTCMTLTPTTTTNSTTQAVVNTTQLQALAEVCSSVSVTDSLVSPVPGPVMNSLMSESKVICNESIPNPITTVTIPIPIRADEETKSITVLSGAIIKQPQHHTNGRDSVALSSVDKATNAVPAKNSTSANAKDEVSMNTDAGTDVSNESSLSPSEPMDCNSTPNISPAHLVKSAGESNEDVAMSETSTSSASMQVEPNESHMIIENYEKKECELTVEDLQLLCDLFYLPFEHGNQGLQLLQEFNWLKSNANIVVCADQLKNRETPEMEEWFSRAEKMGELVQGINTLFQHLSSCQNRELLYDLYPYVWDIRSIISLLNSYVKWLAGGHFPTSMPSYTQGTYTWFSRGWKETFMSGEQEPWVFRGGLTADLQRLIPVDSGNDLFVYKIPDVPTCRVFTVRPYLSTDQADVYNVCTRTCKDGLEDQHTYPDRIKDLHGDRIVGPYVTLHPEFCFVVEDDAGIVGYACASPDFKKFRVKQELAWVPDMCEKYPISFATKDLSRFAQESISYFHQFKDEVFASSPTHPSSMICSLLPSVLDPSVSKRLVTCLLAALRANGSFGVHVVMNAADSYTHAFYGKLGFVENTQEPIKGKIIMGRNF